MICPEKFELEASDAQTHTCDLPEGDHEMHHCPRCGIYWKAKADG